VKRYLYLPQRTVTVEGFDVKDLNGNALGSVMRSEIHSWPRVWMYLPEHPESRWCNAGSTQASAVAALLAHPLTPAGGDNRFDKAVR
jgi:hypothetical protein